MRWILLTFALALLPTGAQAQGTIIGPVQQVLCAKQPPGVVNVGATGVTKIVAAVPGQSIYICGWHVTNSAASGTFQFSYGTGANCGTGNTAISPTQSVTNTAPSADHIDYAWGQVPVGQALCVNPSVATISVLVYYNQF